MFARISSLSAVLISLFMVPDCVGQEALDQIRNHPVDLKILKQEAVVYAVDQLRWKIAQDDAFRGVLEEKLRVIRKRQDQSQHELESIRAELPSRLRFASHEVKASLTGRCIEELLSIQLELATNSEMYERVQMDSAERNKREFDRKLKALKLKAGLLDAQRDNLDAQVRRITELVETGVALSGEATKVKNERLQVDVHLADLKYQMDQLAEQIAEPGGDEIASMRIKIESMKARKAAAEKFLEELSEAVGRERKITRKIERLRRADELLEANKRQIHSKINEIEIRVAETESFLGLIQVGLKKERSKQKERVEDDKATGR